MLHLIQTIQVGRMLRYLKWFIRCVLFFCGTLAVAFVALSFTDIPYLAYHRLGVSAKPLAAQPDLIIVLGGGGMPSTDGLIRCYYAAEAAARYPQAAMAIALPANADGSMVQLNLMARELVLKGVDSTRIRYEPRGANTRAQAVRVAEMFNTGRSRPSVLVVTSPEHMYRAVHAFSKVGFAAGGIPAFEKPVDEVQAEDREAPGDRRVRSVDLRYNMWSYMHYELLVVREYLAIAYYKLKGWI